MFVWLTDWQLAEDHLLIGVGDTVDWTLYPADTEWVARLFADRLKIEWQFDTYGNAFDQPSRRVFGKVTDVRSVRCRQVRTNDGIVPVSGEATLLAVHDTSGSWAYGSGSLVSSTGVIAGSDSFSGSWTGISANRIADYLYGYVLTLALHDQHTDDKNPSNGTAELNDAHRGIVLRATGVPFSAAKTPPFIAAFHTRIRSDVRSCGVADNPSFPASKQALSTETSGPPANRGWL